MQVLVPVVYRMLTIFATLILQNVFLCGENEGNVGLVGWKIWKYEIFCVILQLQNVGFAQMVGWG